MADKRTFVYENFEMSYEETKKVNCYFEFYIASLNSTYVEISLTR